MRLVTPFNIAGLIRCGKAAMQQSMDQAREFNRQWFTRWGEDDDDPSENANTAKALKQNVLGERRACSLAPIDGFCKAVSAECKCPS